MSDERNRIARIIRSLRQRTVENGCTEDEAIAAAEKLRDLLAQHNMTMDEAEIREEQAKVHREEHESDLVSDRLWKVAVAVAFLTDTQFLTGRPGENPIPFTFIGMAHEVEVAVYMLEICRHAMTSERRRLERRHALLSKDAKRRRILPFLDGMADSLARRICKLRPAKPPGTGLVVARRAIIAQAMKDAGIKSKQRDMPKSRDLDDGYGEGVVAGRNVSLNRGVRSGDDGRIILLK